MENNCFFGMEVFYFWQRNSCSMICGHIVPDTDFNKKQLCFSFWLSLKENHHHIYQQFKKPKLFHVNYKAWKTKFALVLFGSGAKWPLWGGWVSWSNKADPPITSDRKAQIMDTSDNVLTQKLRTGFGANFYAAWTLMELLTLRKAIGWD